jgi:hypothetical protein
MLVPRSSTGGGGSSFGLGSGGFSGLSFGSSVIATLWSPLFSPPIFDELWFRLVQLALPIKKALGIQLKRRRG